MSLVQENVELNKELSFTKSGGEFKLQQSRINPLDSLPGQARISLQNGPLKKYLRKAFLVPNLNKLAPYLWLGMTPDHAHISPLHFQAARGRSIVVMENPHLHLVWYYDRIFIKPIPRYLLSSAFWEYAEHADHELWQAAAGFMRTYAYLIEYEIDFRKAQSLELGLVPVDDGSSPITYERFAQFIAPFTQLDDSKVPPRYHFGEMRLTRLNWFARIFLQKLTYHHMHAQWNDYLGKVIAPFLTIFLLLSTVLSAMQVELAVQSAPQGLFSWDTFARVSRWASVAVIILVAVVSFVLTLFISVMTLHNLNFARKIMIQKRAKQKGMNVLKSGVV